MIHESKGATEVWLVERGLGAPFPVAPPLHGLSLL